MDKVLAKTARLIVGIIALAMPAIVSVAPASAQTFNNGGNGCSVMLPDGSGLVKPNAFRKTDNPNVVETEVVVKGDKNCRETVSVAGWNAPYGSTDFQPYANQRLVQGKTFTNLSQRAAPYKLYVLVNPSCDYQADLVLGSSPTNNGTANYGDNLMGYTKFHVGTCQAPPKDVCPNIDGMQTTVPAGMTIDANGNCVTLPPPPVDVCPNIDGMQTVVPAGMVKDANGNCVLIPVDVCPNIAGMQTDIPQGMIKDASGNCVTPTVPVSSCDSLTVGVGANRVATINVFSATATKDIMFKDAIINWGDNSPAQVASTVIGQTHQYTQDGAYAVVVTAHFVLVANGADASNSVCRQVIAITTPTPQPPVTPPTTPTTTVVTTAAQTQPTKLVNTGPGSVLGIFALVSVAGAFFHRQLLARKTL